MPLTPGSALPLAPRDAAMISELIAYFGPRHDSLAAANKSLAQSVKELTSEVVQLRGTVAELTRRVNDMDRQLNGVRRKAGVTIGIARDAFADLAGRQSSLPDMERPIEIDEACAAAGTADARPAVIPEYGNLVVYPKPGTDPDKVWDDVLREIDIVRAANGGGTSATGLRRPRRARKH